MERVFADTGYWIALLNPRDELHSQARFISLQYDPWRIVTSEMVLTEFLNSFSGYGLLLRRAASEAVVSLVNQSQVLIVPQTSNLFEKSLERYQDMADKAWSLTDCSSFLIMEQEQLTAALTHDRHFAQAGFRTLLRLS